MADQQTEMDAPILQSTPTEGFGAVLKRAREAQGISLGDMAARSRLSVPQLRAIEEERMDELPEPVYVRAFIRGIAQALEVDYKPLVADYAARFGADEVGVLPDHDPSTEIVVHTKRRRLGVNLGLVALVVLAIGAGAWAYLNDEPNIPIPPVENATTAVQSAQAESPKAPEVKDQQQAQPTAQADKPDQAPVAPVAPQEVEPQPEPAKVVETPKEVKKPEAPVAKVTERRFSLQTTDACWVQIKLPNGKNLFAKEMRANDVERLQVPVGSKVTVGNANVLTLTVDGQPFELKKVTRNGICRFDVK